MTLNHHGLTTQDNEARGTKSLLLSNLHRTNNALIARPLSEKS